MGRFTDFDVTMREGELKGRKVLITGGAAGIGRDLAIECCKAGANVVIGDLNLAGCQGTADLTKGSSGSCVWPDRPINVVKASSLAYLFAFAKQQWNGQAPDVVVANAGVGEVGDYTRPTPSTNDLGTYPAEPKMTTMEVNFTGVRLTAEMAQEVWKENPPAANAGKKSGRKLIMVSSMAGWCALPIAPMYCASKHGVLGLWQSITSRQKVAPETERFECHAICPWFSPTAIMSKPTRLILAGLPLLDQRLIAVAMAKASSTEVELGDLGATIVLPDHKAPIFIKHEDFDQLDNELYKEIGQIVGQRQPVFDGESYNKGFWNDIARVFGLNALVRA